MNTKRNYIFNILFLLSFLFICPPVFGEILQLDNGKTIEGEIISITDEEVKIQVDEQIYSVGLNLLDPDSRHRIESLKESAEKIQRLLPQENSSTAPQEKSVLPKKKPRPQSIIPDPLAVPFDYISFSDNPTKQPTKILLRGRSAVNAELMQDTMVGIEKQEKNKKRDMFTYITIEFIGWQNEKTVLNEKWTVTGPQGSQPYWIVYDINPPPDYPNKVMIKILDYDPTQSAAPPQILQPGQTAAAVQMNSSATTQEKNVGILIGTFALITVIIILGFFFTIVCHATKSVGIRTFVAIVLLFLTFAVAASISVVQRQGDLTAYWKNTGQNCIQFLVKYHFLPNLK